MIKIRINDEKVIREEEVVDETCPITVVEFLGSSAFKRDGKVVITVDSVVS